MYVCVSEREREEKREREGEKGRKREKERETITGPNRVNQDGCSEVVMGHSVALEADGHGVAVLGLEAEGTGHHDVPGSGWHGG